MTSAHRFHPSILREYDIRGIVGQTLFTADAYAIGRALGTMATAEGGHGALVGRDGRLSSPELEDALVRGLRDAGLDVQRIGIGPTPMLYYATHALAADVAVAVTGSHNPPDHNGFKMMLRGRPFFGHQIQELGRIAADGAYASGDGTVREMPMRAAYGDRVLQDRDGGDRALTVVWDAGNGAAGEVMADLAARLPGQHILLNQEIDGTFPAHHPDHTDPETLEQLKSAVARDRADVGIAFDGDGDRIGVIDGRGRILWGDQIMQMLTEDVLRSYPGVTIIADVKASQALFDEVPAWGAVR